jgi:hypothetical protein
LRREVVLVLAGLRPRQWMLPPVSTKVAKTTPTRLPRHPCPRQQRL